MLVSWNDYRFGKRWVSKKYAVSVTPIFAKGHHKKRGYVLLEEVSKEFDISDSGSISFLIAKNNSERHALIRVGALFEGKGTQSRAVQNSVIVAPKSEAKVAVKCVYASHPISQDSKFNITNTYSPITTTASLMSDNQSSVWGSVASYSGVVSIAVSGSLTISDNLIGSVSNPKFTESIDERAKGIPISSNQVGIIVVDGEGLLGVELFDSPESWKFASKCIIRKYAEAFLKEGKPRTGTTKSFLKDLEGVNFIRETTVFEDKLIYFVAHRQLRAASTGPSFSVYTS